MSIFVCSLTCECIRQNTAALRPTLPSAEVLIENKADVNAEYDLPGSTPLYSMIRGAIKRLERQEDPQASMDIARLLCLSGNIDKGYGSCPVSPVA